MIKKTKYLTPNICLLIIVQALSGQAQITGPDYIRQKFESYCKSVPWEEIYVHTDRADYISGEDLWFNIYLIDRQSLKPSHTGRIAYFEILNTVNKAVVQKKILLKEGSGPGQVVLPDTLSSGIYTIRAYTNRMKNFLPENCFVKDIRVYNALRNDAFRSKRIIPLEDSLRYKRRDNPDLQFNVEKPGEDSLGILIQTDEKFRSENKNIVYLLIQSRGTVNLLNSVTLSVDQTRITVPYKSLMPGINQITIIDSKGAVGDRYFYIPTLLNDQLTINSSEIFKRREKIVLDIETIKNLELINGLTNLSISVSAKSDNPGFPDINEYLIFGTEFGFSCLQSFKERKITEIPIEEMDSIMRGLQSNWIIWEKVFSDEAVNLRFPAEKEDHFISGTLLNTNLQPVFEEEIILMSVPGKDPVFQYTRTDPAGNFNLKIHIDEEIKDLVIQPDLTSQGQKIYIEPAFSNLYIDNEAVFSPKKISSFIAQQANSYQVRKIFETFQSTEPSALNLPGQKSKRFYGIPDREVILKNFIELDSMREVFHELIPNVLFEVINSEYRLSVIDPSKTILEGTPCVMIDGVIIKDLRAIARLEPELVEKIDVIWNRYRIGGYVFNGIINLITKRGDFEGFPLPGDAVRLHFKVLDRSVSFTSPVYSSPEIINSPVADYRNTLYWNPDVKPDKTGKARIEFWSSDIKSEYVINVMGISSDGEFVSLRKKIKVE